MGRAVDEADAAEAGADLLDLEIAVGRRPDVLAEALSLEFLEIVLLEPETDRVAAAHHPFGDLMAVHGVDDLVLVELAQRLLADIAEERLRRAAARAVHARIVPDDLA